MALETEQRVQPLLLESPRRVAERMRAVGDNDQTTADAATAFVYPGEPVLQKWLRGKRRASDFPLRHEDQYPERNRKIEDDLRQRLRRMDGIVFAIGLLLFAVAAVATYLYWEYARPFIATDDPFLAARHSLIALRALAVPCPAGQRAAGRRFFSPRHGV